MQASFRLLEFLFRQREERPERNLQPCPVGGGFVQDVQQGIEAGFVGIAQLMGGVEQQGIACGRRQPGQVCLLYTSRCV